MPAAAIALVGLAGCGATDESPGPFGGLPAAGGGGDLVYAVPALPSTLDPLAASGRIAQLVTRQVHEPLVASLAGPYGDTRPRPGLSLSSRPSADRRVWTFQLRRGVRFQDGTPFNASAVLANWRRWRSSSAGRELLPELFAVDAPRPTEVRFLLEAPAPDLPSRLASAHLGIVSPRALRPSSGRGARFVGSTGTGTGPFEAGPEAGDELDLRRNPGWWGSPVGLGPALDGVSFVRAGSDEARRRLLQEGEVQVAEPLDAASLREAAADPLLRTIEGGGLAIGMTGSVRGLSGAVQSLSTVWLTTVAS